MKRSNPAPVVATLAAAWLPGAHRPVTIGVLVLSALCILVGATRTHAQQPEPWTPPLRLSEGIVNDSGAPANCMNPVLVADAQRQVHAFWTATLQEDGTVADTLYYSRWDGNAWSTPVDLFYLPGTGIGLPQAAVDAQGWIHLVWTGLGSAWYSRARTMEAGSPRAWTDPIEVNDEPASNAFVAVGPAVEGASDVHIVYCAIQEQGYVAYTRSSDGRQWSAPVQIARVEGCFARLAVDGRLVLHLVYADQPGVEAGTAAYYVRSDDSGKTWSKPRQFDVKDARFVGEYGPAYPNVVALGDEEIHVIWDGAPAGQRWHQWSSDGGDTWSQATQISAEHRGLTGPNPLAVDSAGTLHMVSMGWLDTPENPKGAFHTYWANGSWSRPLHIGVRTDWDAEGPTLAIGGGNMLLAAWWHRTGNAIEVWVSGLLADAPALTPAPWPTLVPRPTQPSPPLTAQPTAASSEGISVTATVAFPNPGVAPGVPASSSKVMLIAVVPVLLLIGVVTLLHGRRKGR